MASRPVLQSQDQEVITTQETLASLTADIANSQSLLEHQGRSFKEREEYFANESKVLDQKLDQKRLSVKEEMDRLDGDISVKRDEHSALSTSNENLSADHEALKDKHNNLVTVHAEKESSVAQLIAEESRLSKSVSDKSAQDSRLDASISEKTEVQKVLSQKSEQIEADLHNAEVRLTDLHFEIKKVEDDLKNPVKVRASVEADIKRLCDERDEIEAAVVTKRQELAQVVSETIVARTTQKKEQDDANTRIRGLKILEKEFDDKVSAANRSHDADNAKNIAEEKELR